MDTNLLEIFIDVVRTGSFAKTASKRNVDPSSISRSIAALEQQLNTRLFQRTTRSITLTESGELCLKRIEPICEELTKVKEDIHDLQDQIKGRVRFSTSVAFGQACIVPILPSLKAQYPDLEIDIKLDDRNLDIIDEQLDFAIRLNKTADTRFIRTRVRQSKYYVCAAPSYLNQHKKITNPKDIKDHQLIVFDLPGYRSQWHFISRKNEKSHIEIDGQLTLSNALAIKECTLQGMGISLLADWLVADDIAKGNLINIYPEFQVSADNFDTAIWIIYPERAFLPSKTRVTIDYIRKSILNTKSE